MTVNGPKMKINIIHMVNCHSKSIMAIFYLSWLPLLQLGFFHPFTFMPKRNFGKKKVNFVL